MESHLKWPDYLILVAFLGISLAIGIYHSVTGGRQKTTTEFIMADRSLKVIPTSISLLVSFHSAVTLLGMTAEMYSYGAQYFVFICVAAALSVFFVERFIVPWLYPLKLVSIYDYLDRRFMSKSIRIFASSLGILSGLLFMGVAIYAPSAALEAATGLPLAASIPLMAVVCLTYTALGGMRAVIWTDVFQFGMMVGGSIAVLVKGLIVVGGITNVFRLAEEEGRLVLAKTILLNIPCMIVMYIMACIIGLIVLAYYSAIKCDPLANKDIASPNQLLPYFVVTIFADSPGFSGLFLATLYGGSLSSVSSTLSGSAANCWEDILKWKLNHLQETKKAFINRFLVVLFGILATGVAFLSASVPGPITQFVVAICSSVIGPATGLFVLGAVSRHANWKGTLLGGIVGLLLTLWLNIGALTVKHKHPPLHPVSVEQCPLKNGNITFLHSALNNTNYTSFELLDRIGTTIDWNETTEFLSEAPRHMTQLRGLENFYAMSYQWFAPFGAIVTTVIGIIASLIMRDREQEQKVDERLLLRFHGCGWSDEYKNKEYLDDQNYAFLRKQESNLLNSPQNGFLNDVEMTALKKPEIGIHEEINGDRKHLTENSLVTKEDSRKEYCI